MITPFQLQHWFISLHLPPPYDRTPSVLPAGDLFQTNRQTNKKKKDKQTETNSHTKEQTKNKQTNKQQNRQRTEEEKKTNSLW